MELLSQINDMLWGIPLITLLLGTGIYLTFRLKFLQLKRLKLAFHLAFQHDESHEGDVSSFQALCTALSSTIGTGNIVGVASAIGVGGPGALFWMWMSAFFGMATKYAEGVLAILYRKKDKDGNMAGGPMYYIEYGLGTKWLARLFAFFGMLVALLGIGTMTQSQSIAYALYNTFQIPKVVTAVVLTLLVAFIIMGGIQRIATVAEKVIPLMCGLYLGAVVIIIVTHFSLLPQTFLTIVQSAFGIKPVIGGGIGIAIQKGINRGIFSNESGLGSAPIAAAAAKTNSCVEQGLVSMTGTFIDTLVVCTMTGLAIILTNAYQSDYIGVGMTTYAFETGLPIAVIGKYIVNIGLIFFAFTTIIGWNYYGERCASYLFGKKVIMAYQLGYVICVAIGTLISLDAVFLIADIMNALMAFPNLIALVGLRHEVIDETKKYFAKTN